MNVKTRETFRHRDAEEKAAEAGNKAALRVSSSSAPLACLLEKNRRVRSIL
jgi:hypothetical protein